MGTVQERAELAVADLKRAGGSARTHLLISGTTGTGWVHPAVFNSIEHEQGATELLSRDAAPLPVPSAGRTAPSNVGNYAVAPPARST